MSPGKAYSRKFSGCSGTFSKTQIKKYSVFFVADTLTQFLISCQI
nr:MAG TPA: hypothetical protein [Caudoviricetes sp.]DAI83290.1 MAG TPA: hypothetical protein [Caudoviricetes sp.]DAV70194.1 MAG TPA: hypothetical protein [Caudoviricetes sp.]